MFVRIRVIALYSSDVIYCSRASSLPLRRNWETKKPNLLEFVKKLTDRQAAHNQKCKKKELILLDFARLKRSTTVYFHAKLENELKPHF